MNEMPEVKYAKSGEVHIAYQSSGDGPDDVLVTPGATTTLEGFWSTSWIREIAKSTRVTSYDKRGTGRSDLTANFTFEERTDDIRAVMDAAGIRSAHLCGLSEGGPMSLLFAAMYPDRVRSLTIYGSFPSWMRRADYPHGLNMSLHEYSRWVDRVVEAWLGDPDANRWFWEMFSPTMAKDPNLLSMLTADRSRQASPGAARAIWEALYDVDVRHLLPAIRVPTTIVHFTGDRVSPVGGARYMAEHIPGAKLVEMPGDDHFHTGPMPEFVQAVLDNIERARAQPVRKVDRRLSTVLFTDIVDSTPFAARVGDRAWRELLDRHDSAARATINEYEGQLIKSTGDGLLATFDGPSRAVRCAAALHSAFAALGIPIRAGLHTGEIEIRGDDIAGMAVNIAARVSSLAGSSETLVSSTVKDLVVGSGFTFADRGEHALKGVEQQWRLYALEAV